MKREVNFNLILKERAQKLLDDFATVMNVRLVFFGRSGEVLKRGRDAECTPFCRLIQSEYISLDACLKMDEKMEKKCSESGKCECYNCHAGLCEAVIPVTAPGIGSLGFLMVGQFRNTDKLPAELLAMAKTVRKRRELQRAFKALPYYSMEAFRKMSGLLELLVDYIVRCELINSDGDLFFIRLSDYIDANFQHRITPDTAARALGCSVSALSHRLHEKGHDSFLNILTERRIRNAEALMKNSPDITVAEAAFQSGFQDPYYFSRTYRKYRGEPPCKFKKRISGL